MSPPMPGACTIIAGAFYDNLCIPGVPGERTVESSREKTTGERKQHGVAPGRERVRVRTRLSASGGARKTSRTEENTDPMS